MQTTLNPPTAGSEFPPSSSGDLLVWNYSDYILGFATFDQSGFLKQSMTVDDSADRVWLQAAFQTICLQLLLQFFKELDLGTCQHSRVQGQHQDILLIPQTAGHLGLLLRRSTPDYVVRAIVEEMGISWTTESLLEKFTN